MRRALLWLLALAGCAQAPEQGQREEPLVVRRVVPGQPGKSGPGGELVVVAQAEDASPPVSE